MDKSDFVHMTATNIAAWAALALSVVNSALAIKKWRFDRGNVEPEISISCNGDTPRRDPVKNDGAWLRLIVEMRNVDQYSRTIEAVECVSIPNVIIASARGVWSGNYTDARFTGMPVEMRSTTAHLSLTAKPAGTTSRSGVPQDITSTEIYMFIPDDPSPAFISGWGNIQFRFLVSSGSSLRGRKKISSAIRMAEFTKLMAKLR